MPERHPLAETLNGILAQTEPRFRDPSDVKPLSCTNCRQRKIRCDKSNPCSACKRSGIGCVFPKRIRVRRVKQGNKSSKSRDEELLRRIAKLEALVGKMGGDITTPLTSERSSGRQTTPSSDFPSSISGDKESSSLTASDIERKTSVEKEYFGDDFWANLGGEVNGLRYLLEQSSDDDDSDGEIVESTSLTTGLMNHSSPLDLVFRKAESEPGLLSFPIAHHHFKALTNTYFTNVDPIFKILHRPSTLSSIIASTRNFSGLPDNGVIELLMLCMYFAAVTSLSPQECQQTYHQDSKALLAKLRYAAERAFARENLLATNEFAVLQAFALYLIALRIHSKTRSTWTLSALVLRIAHSFGIHKDACVRNLSFFEAQQRRLLWWQIMVLDVRVAEDQSTQPMIYDGSFDTSMPLNINDDDYGPHTNESVPEFPGLTDMTLSHVTHKSLFTFRKLLFPSHISATQKEQMVVNLSLEFESQYFQKCDVNVPNQWLLLMIGRLLILKMWLSLRYPLQARDQPICVNTAADQTLRVAISILEIMLSLYENSPKSSHFKWLGRTWLQWHPLAVILAELCIQTEGQFVDRAWTVVESVWNMYGEGVAHTEGGRLWKAIKRLLKKAQAARRESNTKRQVEIDNMATRGISKPLPDIMPDFNQMLTNEYNSSLLSGSNAPAHPQAPPSPAHEFDTPYNVIPIQQDSINAEYGNQINWTDWQEFLAYSEASDLMEDNAFEAWPLTFDAP